MFPSSLQASKSSSAIYKKKREKLRKDIAKQLNSHMKHGKSLISIKTDIYDDTTRDELRELGYIADIYGKCRDCEIRYNEAYDEDDDEIEKSIFNINKCQMKNHDAYYKLCVAWSIITTDPEQTLEEHCPICYEPIFNNIQQYSTCSNCQKSLHRQCQKKIKNQKCPLCRSEDNWLITYPEVVF